MNLMSKEISPDVYERYVKNNYRMTREDEETVFPFWERCGYGVYGIRCYERKDGTHYCQYYRGSHCD